MNLAAHSNEQKNTLSNKKDIIMTKPLGMVTVNSFAYNCPSSDPRMCYDLTIKCDEVYEDISVTLHVDEPPG